ncbi:MAG: hypothetical protein AAF405_08885, partial [Pseudomonadota bacterium]
MAGEPPANKSDQTGDKEAGKRGLWHDERPVPTDEELDRTPPLPFVVWAARFSSYFLALGGIMLISYAVYGFDTDPMSFPPGFRLNPAQAAV